MAKKQFTHVSGKYGAPMGRCTYGTPEHAESKINLFRVTLDDGYDDGGAYWGWPNDLFCGRDKDGQFQQFCRADSRAMAADMLEIPNHKLSVPIKGREVENAS